MAWTRANESDRNSAHLRQRYVCLQPIRAFGIQTPRRPDGLASTGIVRLLVPVPAPSLFITSLNVLADDKADQLTCYALHPQEHTT